MRARQLAALTALGRGMPGAELSASFEARVELDGPRAAAWLAWVNRRIIRRGGGVVFRIPGDAETPAWFRVAFEALGRRQRWSVAVTLQRGERCYVVRWLEWGRWRRGGLPREVQPALG